VRRLLALSVAVVALALTASMAVGAPVASSSDPGVTPTSILIGGTVPLTGEAAAFGSVGPGAKAYFDYVNARGGVYGRKIVYRYYDDGYDPSRTVQLTRQLVEQDKVFAVFNSIGTANNIAIRDYLNTMKVPQLFAGDGSDAIGGSPKKYPYTMGFLQSYRGEGAVYGRDLAKRNPKARIAVLFENSDLGKDMTRGLSRAIAGKGPKIAASQSYEYTASDVSSQIAQLKASGANTLMLFSTPKFMIQAVVATHKLGWQPQLYIASVSIEPTIMGIASVNAPELTKGALSVAFVKNPNDPIWAKDKALALYLKVMKAYDPSGKPSDVYNWYGMTVAWTMVETLKAAGRSPTRASLLRAATHLDLRGNPFLLPGIVIRTTPTQYFPLSQVYLYRWNNKQWVKSSGLLPAS
jgi:branched-chain amino acid transport system substrate-binding protein